MRLNKLANNPGAKKTGKRVGRGIGSGKGKTCGRGVKGQKSRSGVAIKGFEGGQMPLIKRLPKRGFNCRTTKIYQVINISDIEAMVVGNRLNASETITKEHLVTVGLVKNATSLIKLLGGGGKINQKLSIKLDACSAAAKKIIEEAGGQVL